ncbi:hypothetical protein PVAND_003968 [Polypedilum vanderplanki]|uniref:Zinc finger protein n=1 Tax=Polypedilum vanderplanki TaxID=319348 RepID=A0A9J6BVQ3_POLVA|nr:hypothetical protein PVAND_003968 [Polypedilum vanderplanki]
MEEIQGKSKSLTILQKLEIIEMVKNGRSVKDISEELGVNRNTLHYILKNRDKITEASKKPGLSYHKRIKQTKNPELEKTILDYIHKAKTNGEKLTGSIIKAVALETSLKMNSSNFAASNGWLFSFLKRNNISMNDLNGNGENLSIKKSSPLQCNEINDEENEIVYEEFNNIDESIKHKNEEIEELEITTENDINYPSVQINWRNWCRLCGNIESLYILESQLLDTVKNLFDITNLNEEIRVCNKCNITLEEISNFIHKGKLIESMFNELEEREKMNCLSDESIFVIRHEYVLEDETSLKEEQEQSGEHVKDSSTKSQQLENVVTEESLNDALYEVDYLEEEDGEEMDYSLTENQQHDDENVEQEYIVEDLIDEDEEQENEDEVYQETESENINSKLLREEELYTYTCHICFENFERMCFLTNHTRQQHDCLPQVACTCGKLLSTWESLMNHKRKHSSEVGEWICALCDARFITKTGLSIHIKFKHEKQRKNYNCKICNKEFAGNQLLRNHEKTHLPENERFQVECEICGKKLSSKYSLRHHITTVHEQQKTILCHLCSKAFSNRSNLKSHLISHTTENVRCEICHSTFKNSVSLQSHKKIHKPKELLNFACSECDKKFHNRNHLERHQISHSDARNFKCESCGQSYKWEKDLRNHISAIHKGEKENKCIWCESSFVDVGNLRKHKIKYHPYELAEFEKKYGKKRRLKSIA